MSRNLWQRVSGNHLQQRKGYYRFSIGPAHVTVGQMVSSSDLPVHIYGKPPIVQDFHNVAAVSSPMHVYDNSTGQLPLLCHIINVYVNLVKTSFLTLLCMIWQRQAANSRHGDSPPMSASPEFIDHRPQVILHVVVHLTVTTIGHYYRRQSLSSAHSYWRGQQFRSYLICCSMSFGAGAEPLRFCVDHDELDDEQLAALAASRISSRGMAPLANTSSAHGAALLALDALFRSQKHLVRLLN